MGCFEPETLFFIAVSPLSFLNLNLNVSDSGVLGFWEIGRASCRERVYSGV